MPKKISKKEKQDIIKYYKSRPMSFDEVSNKFNISLPTVGKIIKEFRIKPYSKNKLFSPNLVEDYFENIDNEYKAYFLGMIISDGCVHCAKGRKNIVCLTVKDEDSYILQTLLNEIKSNKKITSDGRGCSSIQIISEKMSLDLKKYGVIPNKSLKTVIPNNISKDMMIHVFRGIFDGDGSVAYYKRKDRANSYTKAIRLCQGNEQFLKDYVNFLYDNFKIQRTSIYKEKDNLWSIAYRKNESILKIIDIFYSNSNIYLKRKKQKCDLIKKEISGNTEIIN